MVPKALPSVLIVHTGGTLGMDPLASYEPDVDGRERLKGGGSFKGTLGPGMSLQHHKLLSVQQQSMLLLARCIASHIAAVRHK